MRARLAFLLVVPVAAVACARDPGHPSGDAATDGAFALVSAPNGLDAGKPCRATPPAWSPLDLPPVDVLILLDNSESMGTSRGTGTRASVLADFLAELVDAYQARIRFGFAPFPGQDALCSGLQVTGCCVGRPSESGWIEPGHPEQVKSALRSLPPPRGNSPVASALQRVPEYFGDDTKPRYVLLATDGLPSCTLSGGLSSNQSVDGGLPLGSQDALFQVQALSSLNSIKVMVLASGGDDADQSGPLDYLDQIAHAGGLERPGGKLGYYSVSARETLQQAIREKIFGLAELPSCELILPKPYVSNMRVYLDDQEIPQNRKNGWDFDSSSSREKIRIFGEYCDRIQQLRYSTCSASYSCDLIST